MNKHEFIIELQDGSTIEGTIDEISFREISEAIETGRSDTWVLHGQYYRTYQLKSIRMK